MTISYTNTIRSTCGSILVPLLLLDYMTLTYICKYKQLSLWLGICEVANGLPDVRKLQAGHACSACSSPIPPEDQHVL